MDARSARFTGARNGERVLTADPGEEGPDYCGTPILLIQPRDFGSIHTNGEVLR